MSITGTQFKKPYCKDFFGKEMEAHYAYPAEKLSDEPIFPYFVFDGGAFNFINDRLGVADADSLLEKTMSGELFDLFKLHGEFNWEAGFGFMGEYRFSDEFITKYEWQLWPQRLYMILPVAQAYLKTGDKKYADAWFKIVKGWDDAHDYQPFDPTIDYLKTDMVWRDMQVAWRTISVLHSLFMLQDAPFTKEEWGFLYDFVKLHVNHLYVEAIDRIERNHKQNHVLQIGVALIMGGCMFPELENAAECVKIGCDTVKMNMDAIFSDGGSDEDSPSYSHFIVRLYLEAYLFLENNKLPQIEGMKQSIERQYEWLYQCLAPNGSVMRFSDSYAFDAEADIRRAGELFPLEFERKQKSMLFPESQVATIRKGDIILAVDAMNIYDGHRHWGRPQTLLYYKGQPILVDSGCCNYDLWDFYHYIRSFEAHNVVYCSDFSEFDCKLDLKIKSYDEEKGEIVTLTKVSYFDKSYEWERRLVVGENKLEITDTAWSENELNWASSLHFPRYHSTIAKKAATSKFLLEDFVISVTTDKEHVTRFVPLMNEENKVDYARLIENKGFGKEFTLKTVIEFKNR